jgi:membrane protease YdiL (CAAX protease family)
MIKIISVSVIFTLLYNNTNRNILVALLFHTMLNLSSNLFTLLEKKPDGDQSAFIFMAFIYLVVSVIVVLTWGRDKLSRQNVKSIYQC